jgi:hypothetical protein
MVSLRPFIVSLATIHCFFGDHKKSGAQLESDLRSKAHCIPNQEADIFHDLALQPIANFRTVARLTTANDKTVPPLGPRATTSLQTPIWPKRDMYDPTRCLILASFLFVVLLLQAVQSAPIQKHLVFAIVSI